MPCYEVRTMSVEFYAQHIKVLERALSELGWKFFKTNDEERININDGEIVIDLKAGSAKIRETAQDKLNQLKRAYSLESIKTAARNHAWTIGKITTKGKTTIGQMTKYG